MFMELNEQEQADLKKDLLTFVKRILNCDTPNPQEIDILFYILRMLCSDVWVNNPLVEGWCQKVTFGKDKPLEQEGEVVIVPQPLIPEQGDRWVIKCNGLSDDGQSLDQQKGRIRWTQIVKHIV